MYQKDYQLGKASGATRIVRGHTDPIRRISR